MRTVFIIAIVAVTMIGVMVPSVFATHDNDVDLLLPENWDLENYWSIKDVRGDRSYTSSGAYIEGFEKSYDRIDGQSFVGLSAAIYEVTEDTSFDFAQDIAFDERERYFESGKMQAPKTFSDFKPFGFPSECKAIKIEYGDIYGNVKIKSYCVKNQYHFSVIALGTVWDIDNDVIDFTKIILTTIDEHSSVVPTPPSQENSAAAIATTSTNVTVADGSTYSVDIAMGSGSPGCETSNACYLPAYITISSGNTVQWNNIDTGTHTVIGGNPAEGPSGVFDSGIIMADSSYSHTFDDPGNYDYFCVFHPWMEGVIVVGEKQYSPSDEPAHTSEPEPLGIASFVDQMKDPQHYIDRYNNEEAYKEWFDSNYSQYSSIYQAVGLDEPTPEPVIESTPEPVIESTPEPNCGTGTIEKDGKCVVESKNTSKIKLISGQWFEYDIDIEMDGTRTGMLMLDKMVKDSVTEDGYDVTKITKLRVEVLQVTDTYVEIERTIIMIDDEIITKEKIDLNVEPKANPLFGEPFIEFPPPAIMKDFGDENNSFFIESINLKGEKTLTINKQKIPALFYRGYSSLDSNENPQIPNNAIMEQTSLAEYYYEKSTGMILKSTREITLFGMYPPVGAIDMRISLTQSMTDYHIPKEKSSKGGGCLIATATYGSEMSQQVQQLRELRDNQLLQTESGTQFMSTFNDVYYSFSPMIADYERENQYFKEAVKLAITPMISSLSLMENAESESEVLSIGISVIMLNLGMYLGVPAIVAIGIRKRF